MDVVVVAPNEFASFRQNSNVILFYTLRVVFWDSTAVPSVRKIGRYLLNDTADPLRSMATMDS